jgi:hypothetical protein
MFADVYDVKSPAGAVVRPNTFGRSRPSKKDHGGAGLPPAPVRQPSKRVASSVRAHTWVQSKPAAQRRPLSPI